VFDLSSSRHEGAEQMNIRIATTLFALIAFIALVPIAAAQNPVKVGDPAPRGDVTLVDGSILGERDTADKVILTVFWATWCHICMRELPEFQKLRDRHHADGFEVLAISVDSDSLPVEDYLERSGLSFPVAMRTEELKSAWGPVQGTPLLYVTDRKGVLRVRHLGAADLGELERSVVSLLQAERSTR